MTRAMLLALLLPVLAPASAAATGCEQAGQAAEQAAGLPADLLVAIGRVESGRRGADGRVTPWPWSVNAAGEGHYLASAAEAVALVETLQARGIRSIDVGCFQVNLLYHGGSFASVDDAFDPDSNARAAAGFLGRLIAGGGLDDAVARYHSADPARGVPYLHQVMASWHGGAAALWPSRTAFPSQVAMLVRVWGPGGDASAPLPPRRAGGLPVVIVPTGGRS